MVILFIVLSLLTTMINAAEDNLSKTRSSLPRICEESHSKDKYNYLVAGMCLTDQNNEQTFEFITRAGNRLSFKVKLGVHIMALSDAADVKVEVFQRNRLIDRRGMRLFWK
jgi:hypothetical protein